MQFKIIFLDIDGVLNDHKVMSNNYCGIKKECVEQLNRILEDKDVRIVISSAWRYLIIRGSMTLKGFEELLLSHGVNCYGKVVGITQSDEFITERSEQISDWIILNKVQKYIILDDLDIITLPNFIKTNGSIGLTEQLANLAIERLS